MIYATSRCAEDPTGWRSDGLASAVADESPTEEGEGGWWWMLGKDC